MSHHIAYILENSISGIINDRGERFLFNSIRNAIKIQMLLLRRLYAKLGL